MSWTSVFSTKRWEFSTPRGDDGMRFEDRRGLVQFCTPRLVKACELENLNFFQAPVLLPVKDPNNKLIKPGAICEMEWLLCHASMLSTETIPNKTSYWHKQPQLSYYSPLSSHQCALMAISHVLMLLLPSIWEFVFGKHRTDNQKP